MEAKTMAVAETILDQLGGRKFAIMTGSKDFYDLGKTLKMTLARNKSKANRLDITLNAMDTYDLTFYKYSPVRVNYKTLTVKDSKVTLVEKIKGIYFDQLQDFFTKTTGFYTRL